LILAIDPGNEQSAYVLVDNNLRPIDFDKVTNQELRYRIMNLESFEKCSILAIEMVASYGMPVGAEVFETCVWIGRFVEACVSHLSILPIKVYRKDVKIALCNSQKAKDSNIRQALIDRFGEVGTKRSPGWFYGFKADIWQAYAVAVTYADKQLRKGA
jgi:hypothetical protein